MATITISISDESLAQLQAAAERYAVKPEDLVRVSLDELLKRPDDGLSGSAEAAASSKSDDPTACTCKCSTAGDEAASKMSL